MGTNQGESSNESKVVKTPYQMGSVQNRDGSESSVSETAGLGASSGEQAIYTPPANEINISASEENRSAKFKAPNVSQDQGAGANQYE